MAVQQGASHLVVVGSSAGGIEALATLVSTLPPDFPAPIVLAQHIHPDRKSRLEEILAHRSALPVRTVEGPTTLEPGVIFVVPADRHVTITEHTLEIGSEMASRPKPSVDLLFETAADAFGEQLIAVVLTGTGHDGTAGARRVKERGGTVVIQNPQTADFPGMPRSLAPSTVDMVAELEAIGPLLYDLLTKTKGMLWEGDEELPEEFLKRVRALSGIDFSNYKPATIQRRLARRMAATGFSRPADYLEHLTKNPDEYKRLVSSFLIKVTEFFRDPELFEYLQKVLLPTVIRNASESGTDLRLWSAGCATGEEAYSLALILCEALGSNPDQITVRLFATDLDTEAIAFARRGVYPAAALANLPLTLIARYFTEVEGSYELSKRVRGLVIFGEHDLGQRAPFPHIDLVLCRNVLIYFTPELQQHALQLFHYALRDGGYLVLGKSETVASLADSYTLIQSQLRVYRRTGGRPLPLADVTPHLPMGLRRARSVLAAQAGTSAPTTLRRDPAMTDLMLHLPVGIVVVDRRYDVQRINPMARRLLGIKVEALGADLLHLLTGVPTRPLRVVIDATLRGEQVAPLEDVPVEGAVPGEIRYVRITCVPTNDTALLVLTDSTSAVQQQLELTRLQVMYDAVRQSNQELTEANEQLIDTSMALRSANEEFLVGSEELQAASEETETLNEELQATNEELETLNEELQSTNEELNAANEDLLARSNELNDLAGSLGTQRNRLAAILHSLGEAVLVLDQSGRVILTSTNFDTLLGEAGPAFVAEDLDGKPLPQEQTPQERARRGEIFSMEFTLTNADGGRRWFEAEGRPIRLEGLGGDGVLVIRDVTDRSVRRLQEEFLAMAGHELRTPLTALQGHLELLLRRANSEGDQQHVQRYAGVALAQARHMGVLIRDLTDTARLYTGKLSLTMTDLDLGSFCQQMVEMAQPLAKGQVLRLEVPEEAVLVRGDAVRLQQVILNLLINAITYASSESGIDVRVYRREQNAIVEVQDYGPGMNRDHVQHIFTRFYRIAWERDTSSRGLGLGLYIAREIISGHDGTLEVTSELERGSTFTVRLPLQDETRPLEPADLAQTGTS